jgi:hypothetical protein
MDWYKNIKYWKIGKKVYVLEDGYFYTLNTKKKTHQMMRGQYGVGVWGMCVKTAKMEYRFKPDDDSS